MPPSNQNLVAGFDPTGQTTITAAQLLAMINSATPFSDKGMVVVTTDVAGVPQVPDARDGMGNELWQKFVWGRVQQSTASLYIWSPGSALDATFLYWVPTSISVPSGFITGNMIADNTIPATKIISVDWSQITGTPTSGFTPTGPAGGSLNGTYPNPGIAPLAVTTPTINAEAVTNAKLSGSAGGAPAVDITKNIITNGVWPALGMLRVNAAATGLEAVPKLITQLAEPVAPTDALKVVRVNAAALAYELVASAGFSALYNANDPLNANLPANDVQCVFPHGLGAVPKVVQVFAKCLIAENGYSVGDLIPMSCIQRNADPTCPVTYNADATNVTVVIASALTPGTLRFVKKGDGSTLANLTRADWIFHVVAFL